MKNPIVIERQQISPIEEAAKQSISVLIARKAELKDKRQALENELEEDKDYANLKTTIKNMNKQKTERKKDLISRSSNMRLQEADIKELATNVKEKQLTLFDYLLEFTKKTGEKEIRDNTGQVHQIIKEAKIKI